LFDDDRLYTYKASDLIQLELSYAITVHKSQGSEYEYVILPISEDYSVYKKLYTRSLLYTAMTRAKRMLIILGTRKAIEFMINNVVRDERKTALGVLIEEFR